ncbi:CDP-glycerol glycerophosphotransferase family protein [Heyndrickxia acidicola]|uniref:CDP-glycerol glycerophosphotransferase family protein n=1 Tax=Heyndrickxia acidicola TaxID=209389 RepID=A0ABU6MH47_9BACI|nr:CDP-glycerol glycerophosphotransferase family protein [Heyndrickxia acidicola]MED1203754.1 CDP-glycerol glycerophosphotransferase family protein [Heyndrickxia acidicola]
MGREILIELYLFLFRLQFIILNWIPVKNKLTFVISFEQNSFYIYEELLKRQADCEIVFICDSSCYDIVKNEVNAKVLKLNAASPISWFENIYHLATSKTIIVDNYFGFLAAVSFKAEVECIQIWHAAGAIKTFGLKDHSLANRSSRAIERFKKVYNQFHKVVVGSDEMAAVFQQAFGVSSDRFLYTGVPRTDLFFSEEKQKHIIADLYRENHHLSGKKVILYAPTFRDGSLDTFEIKLDLDYLYQTLGDEYVLIVKLHPAIRNKSFLQNRYHHFIMDYSDYRDINDLLLITDYLITDYSSIPYEYALINKPMLFYAYDKESYQKQRGLWMDYEKMVPGPVVTKTEEIVSQIKENRFDYNRIRYFSSKWNKYSHGHSAGELVNYLYKERGIGSPEKGRQVSYGT